MQAAAALTTLRAAECLFVTASSGDYLSAPGWGRRADDVSTGVPTSTCRVRAQRMHTRADGTSCAAVVLGHLLPVPGVSGCIYTVVACGTCIVLLSNGNTAGRLSFYILNASSSSSSCSSAAENGSVLLFVCLQATVTTKS
jgi:hypothetical protein